MSTTTVIARPRCFWALASAALLAGLTLPALAANHSFSAQKPAEPGGTVEIVNVAGSVEISGWDQPLVDVTGTIGSRVERVDVTSSANRTTVRVVLPSGGNAWSNDNEARLKIRVPQNSALEVSLVSADLRVTGVSGNHHLQTVSGDITGDAGGELQVNTVSGDVMLTARNSHSAQFKTVSGDLHVSGADGDVLLDTVSGDAILTLGPLTRAHLETVSGDLAAVTGALAAGAQFDASSVSGDLRVDFAAAPDADIDVQSFSGEITNCFGPKPVEEQYGPGSRLSFRSGKGGGRVHIDTKSGDVRLCNTK
jgi:Putative adhesin